MLLNNELHQHLEDMEEEILERVSNFVEQEAARRTKDGTLPSKNDILAYVAAMEGIRAQAEEVLAYPLIYNG
jgi:hypothetical protein